MRVYLGPNLSAIKQTTGMAQLVFSTRLLHEEMQDLVGLFGLNSFPPHVDFALVIVFVQDWVPMDEVQS